MISLNFLNRSFSLISTPFVCDPVASPSLALCVFDIGILYSYHYHHRLLVRPLRRENFGYSLLFSNLAIRVVDAILFYSPSVDHRPGSDRGDIFMFLMFAVSFIYFRLHLPPEPIRRQPLTVGVRDPLIGPQGRNMEERIVVPSLWNIVLFSISECPIEVAGTVFVHLLFTLSRRLFMGDC